jgi:hypothetical protein
VFRLFPNPICPSTVDCIVDRVDQYTCDEAPASRFALDATDDSTVSAPVLDSVIGYVAAAPFSELPNFNSPVGVVPLTGTDSIQKSSVLSIAVAVVFHTCDRNRTRGLICTGTPAVEAVAFDTTSPSVDVVTIPGCSAVIDPVNEAVPAYSAVRNLLSRVVRSAI